MTSLSAGTHSPSTQPPVLAECRDTEYCLLPSFVKLLILSLLLIDSGVQRLSIDSRFKTVNHDPTVKHLILMTFKRYGEWC